MFFFSSDVAGIDATATTLELSLQIKNHLSLAYYFANSSFIEQK